jgi:hypothetical protein
VTLDHRLEVDRGASGAWEATRLDARLAVSLGQTVELSANYLRDRRSWWSQPPDSLVSPMPQRERAGIAASYHAGTAYVAADLAAVLDGAAIVGRTYTGTLRLPRAGGAVAAGGSASYWVVGGATGLSVTPSLDLWLGRNRGTLGYELFRQTAATATSVSHGGRAALIVPLTGRVEWMVRVSARTGQNLHSTSAYSSLRIGF